MLLCTCDVCRVLINSVCWFHSIIFSGFIWMYVSVCVSVSLFLLWSSFDFFLTIFFLSPSTFSFAFVIRTSSDSCVFASLIYLCSLLTLEPGFKYHIKVHNRIFRFHFSSGFTLRLSFRYYNVDFASVTKVWQSQTYLSVWLWNGYRHVLVFIESVKVNTDWYVFVFIE